VTRLAAARTGLCAALAALVCAGFLSIRLADARRAEAVDYRAAVIERDRAVAAFEPARPARRGLRVCPKAVDGYARAIATALGLRLLGAGGELDVAALARLSGLALTAERRAERAAAGPALPQRMGRDLTAPAAAPCVSVPRRR
jgi:hypothetical protein